MPRRPTTIYACTACGSQSPKWLGRCPDCNAWNSFAEETSVAPVVKSSAAGLSTAQPLPIDSIDADDAPRVSTGMTQFDRVLGGGLVAGSVILVGGEPGIGKSTLLLQISHSLASTGPVLYVSGEESPRQIALRGRRLGALHPSIALFSETSLDRVVAAIEERQPSAAIIDSIQTMYTPENSSAPGSMSQVRESAAMLMMTAKRTGVPIFLIGHITKEGTIAGPKTLEHIVDTVLYFEGDRFHDSRIVRAVKNRFGPVNELAMYAMHDDGLEEIPNPSATLLSQRTGASGSAVVVTVEGTRPLLIEVQALVSRSTLATPRRMAMGLDHNRVSLLLAVLEKRGGTNFLTHDVYVNIAGGLEADEPALDLGVVAAIVSSESNRAIPWDLCLFGEVGLLGEIRRVSQADLRAREAAALGFRRIVVPESNAGEIRADIEVLPVRRIEDFAAVVFGAGR
jgi:DNA repair protein RadA/Sms